jgi:hypothetical protein
VTWRGTVLLLLAGFLAAALLLITLRTRTRPADAPLLGIVPAGTTGMVITAGESTTILENRDGVWWISRPLLDRADPAKVAGILDAASALVPMDKLRPADLKGSLSLESLDLKPVKRSLAFQGGVSHTLRLGSEGATPDRVYAQIDSDPSVYLVSPGACALAFQPANELRDPRPFSAQPGQLSEIVLRQPGGYRELSLRRKGHAWMIEAPLRTRADADALSDWIGGVLGSRILRWMPADTEPATCGLDSPEATLTLREQGGEPVRLELGKAVPETPGARYARTPGRPGIFVLGGTEAWLAVMPSTLRLRHAFPVELDSVDRIIMCRGAWEATLSRKPGTQDWLCGERTIPGEVVSTWCKRLEETAASSFEAATPDHLAARGLDHPSTVSEKTYSAALAIRFVAHLSENSAEESAGEMTLAEWTIGRASPDGTIALREGQADDLMILPSGIIIPLLEEAVGWSAPPAPVSPTPTSSPTAQ